MDELNEVAKQLFSGAGGASALLSGFSFAAALQLLGRKERGPGIRAAALLLYAATFLFLFAVFGFTNASARPIPKLLVDGEVMELKVLDVYETSGGYVRSYYTMEFYKAFAAEFILVGCAMIAFISGAVVSAWIRSPVIGKSVLGLVIMIFATWVAWWFTGWR